ncbi:MAG: ATP-binding protein [Elainellaceae cyanobacterium]
MSPMTLKQQRSTLLAIGASDRVRTLLRLIEQRGHKILMATSGEEGMALLKTISIDLILLSPSLPDGGDGYSLCHQLKGCSSSCTIPVVFVISPDQSHQPSSHVPDGVVSPVAAFMVGGADCIVEPFNFEDAIDCLDHHMALAAARSRSLGLPLGTKGYDLEQSKPLSNVDLSPPGTLDLEQRVEVQAAQLQQGLDFSNLLKRIVREVRDTLDEAQILQAAVDELGQGLSLDYSSAALHYSRREPAALYSYTRRDGADGSVVQRLRSDVLRLNPVFCDGGEIQFCQDHGQWGKQLVLACPIIDSQGILGDLWLSRPADRDIIPLEVSLVQHVADQCAIAIRQSRLYKTAQDHVALLEGLHRQKDDFLSTVSHELRSPVTNMKMAIQMLTMSLNGLSDSPAANGGAQTTVASPAITTSKLKQYLQILSGECDREISLINDLLDLQRLDSGAQSPSIGLVSLKSWLANIVQPFKDRMLVHQQALTFQCLTPLTSFRTDTVAVQRILTELLDNACKYTPANETILVTARMIEHALQIQVTNSGIEIPPEHLPYIFDKFYRVPSNTQWQKGGTGLGLALVKHLVNQIGGTVQVHSQHGKTSFRVMIPATVQ